MSANSAAKLKYFSAGFFGRGQSNQLTLGLASLETNILI